MTLTSAEAGPAPRAGIAFTLSVAVAILLAAALSGAVASLAEAYPVAAPMQRWVLFPAFVLAASWALLGPGVLIAAGLRPRPIAELVLLGFGASHVLLIGIGSVMKLVGATPFGRAELLIALGVAWAGAAVFFLRRERSGRARVPHAGDATQLLALLGIAPLVALLFFPEMLWQDLSADGMEAFEIGRSLEWTVLPRFPTGNGFLGLGIGMVTFSWSNHWWMSFVGPIEAAARLPLGLHTTVMAAALVALIQAGHDRQLRWPEWAALLLAVMSYVATMGFTASYDPYFADLSSPAAYESLTVALLGALLLLGWQRSWGWFALIALLGVLARPTTLLVVLAFAAAVALLDPARRRDAAIMAALGVAVFALAFLAYEQAAARLLTGEGVGGYGSPSIAGRFRYLVVPDLTRLAWLVLPAGIVPWLALGRWRSNDPFAKAVSVVVLLYAALFLPLAFTNLHQFAPAMVLPLAVIWRADLSPRFAHARVVLASAGALLAIAVAWPEQRTVNRDLRERAVSIAYRVGDYHGNQAERRRALAGGRALQAILRPDWNVPDPSTERVGGFQLVYYATMPKPPFTDLRFLAQETDRPAPAEMVRLWSDSAFQVWASDSAALTQVRTGNFRTKWRRWPYDIPRTTLFPYVGLAAGVPDVDVIAFLQRFF